MPTLCMRTASLAVFKIKVVQCKSGYDENSNQSSATPKRYYVSLAICLPWTEINSDNIDCDNIIQLESHAANNFLIGSVQHSFISRYWDWGSRSARQPWSRRRSLLDASKQRWFSQSSSWCGWWCLYQLWSIFWWVDLLGSLIWHCRYAILLWHKN